MDKEVFETQEPTIIVTLTDIEQITKRLIELQKTHDVMIRIQDNKLVFEKYLKY